MLTLQFVPYHEIAQLSSEEKISKLLDLVKDDKIVLMQGRLKVTEETKLIETTMNEINSKFKGIEICSINPKKKNETFSDLLKRGFVKVLLGNREGLTIIGPATVIKQIKKDPDKIELLTTDVKEKKKRKSKKR